MIIKILLVLSLFWNLSHGALALEGDSLFDSLIQTQKKVAAEMVNPLAWQAFIDSKDQITSKVLAKDGLFFNYQCKARSYGLTCHEKDFVNSGSKVTDVERYPFIAKLFGAAYIKFIASLDKKLKTNEKVIDRVTCWPEEVIEEANNSHHHGTNIWTKFEYTVKGVSKTSVVVCHIHKGEKDAVCHYRKEGSSEPSFQ